MSTNKITIEGNSIDVVTADFNRDSVEQSVVEPHHLKTEVPILPIVEKNSTVSGADENISSSKFEQSKQMDQIAGKSSQNILLYKDEPTDIEMDLAEDFTKNTAETSINKKIKQETSYQEQIAVEQAVESQAVLQIANSSLSLLSQYISSDSESNITDSEEELPKTTTQPIKRELESEDSDDSVEVVENTLNYRNHPDAILVSDVETVPSEKDNQSDDDLFSSEEDSPPPNPVKGKGETLIHELPPIEELQISVPESQCKSIGYVQSIVAQIVIVQSLAGVELLNIDTVLFLEKGKRSLGKIFDVIGQVASPMYCVLFNSRQEVTDKGITVGAPVFCAPQTEHTQFIILSELMKHKGSDASWLDDAEAPDYALDYSDDEQERRARTRRKSHTSSTGRQTPDGERQQHRPYYRRGRGRGLG
ncbi:H/ACA ribonucleoprotein complex non-core subunit NAF1-like [Sabethes cyaneus]|uniref:H/ACA ribonucleoprotein complex non-core subunit NAF1-like n=1 Tax=Sabethes cyaneus TaxID=53552 RepID=UPI00237D3E9A|nr:H/ACA ribonucleoprotein complex non-core subunit NAF1-like [Sabethes cyaneus]